MKLVPTTLAAVSVWLGCGGMSGWAHDHDSMDNLPATARLGAIVFETTCQAGVRSDFNRGVALLHSFALGLAEQQFRKVATRDPDCAMAYWGIAMSHANQVNGGPAESDLAPARRALARADRARERDAREATYIHALHILFDEFKHNDFLAFAARYTEAMGKLARAYPTDLEAQVFYALALLNSDPPDDVGLVNPRQAVAILYPLFRQHPEHPGIAHYIIHACDNPLMARDGLEAARRYATIAPAAPHALHMPGHIFARLGLWQDDIVSNLASKAAAEDPRNHAGVENRLHAMEFLEYAYLQTGRIAAARDIVRQAKSIKVSDLDPRYAGYYSTVETRYEFLLAVETQDWPMAAGIKPTAPDRGGSGGLAVLAHAMAAGHLRDTEAGRKAQLAANRLRAKLTPAQRTTATLPDEIRAWAAFSQGDLTTAIATLRPVADREAKVGKGEVELPAREMMAEMLFLSGRYGDALAEYQASLASDPNRFNGLLGAAQSATEFRQPELAERYYGVLHTTCSGADGTACMRLAAATSRDSRAAR
jgi:tetratricopeptide (TPR) repeat protein